MKRIVIIISLFLSLNLWAQPVKQGLDAITPELIKGQMNFLASDWTEGRETGTKGAYMAADYIASVFDVIGVKPCGDKVREGRKNVPDFFQEFDLIRYKSGKNNKLSIIKSTKNSSLELSFNYQTDFSVYPGSVGLDLTAPLVFVGYGINDDDLKINELPKKHVEGKIIVRMSGYPQSDDTTSVFYKDYHKLSWWRLSRKKNEWAKEAGALAIIEIEPEREMNPSNVPFRYEYRDFESDDTNVESYYSYRRIFAHEKYEYAAPTIRVSNRLSHLLLSEVEIDPENYVWKEKQKPLDLMQNLKLKTEVESELIRVRNVLGMIEGKNTDEWVVVGGHYDHVGKYNGYIYNGADDNASGTVGVMSIAKAMLATGEQPEKTIVFAAWTGEESGLYGSKYFTQNIPEGKEVVAYLNYDMISRDSKNDSLKNESAFLYSKNYEGFFDLATRQIEENNINLKLKPKALSQAGGGSDHQPFMQIDVPIFYYFAAMHDTYHQPGDELSKINWEKMQNIIKAGFLNVYHMANSNIDDLNYSKKE